jgi:hypothetical protein
MIRWLVRAMGEFRISSILSLLASLRVGDSSKGSPIMSFNVYSPIDKSHRNYLVLYHSNSPSRTADLRYFDPKIIN